MSVQFNGTVQGRFTADGSPKILQIRQDIDWMKVYNLTAMAQSASDLGVEFTWLRGMDAGRGLFTKKLGAVASDPLTAEQIAATEGFYLIDSTNNAPEARLTTTQIDGSAPPVVSSADTGNLRDGDIVRIGSVPGAKQLGGLDFTIGSLTIDSDFELSYAPTIVTTGAVTGYYRRIPFDAYYYPRNRYITAITQASQAVVTLSVTHAYTVGQKIRFVMPSVTSLAYGMTELDGVEATITAVSSANNTITVDVDTSSYTAFAFPLTADAGFTPAQVVPVGEDMAQALSSAVNDLGDATLNTGYIGMLLQSGNDSPAGNTSDVIYWIAGKSFSVSNS